MKRINVFRLITSLGKSHGKQPPDIWTDVEPKQNTPIAGGMEGQSMGVENPMGAQAPVPEGVSRETNAPAPPNLVNSPETPIDLIKQVANSNQIQV